LLVAALVLAARGAPEEAGGELTIAVPAKVQKTIEREVRDGKILGLHVEREAEGAVYAVRAEIDKSRYRIVVREEGDLLHKHLADEEGEDARERQMPLDAVPAAVKATLLKEAHGARIRLVHMEDRRVTYSVRVRIDGGLYWIAVDEKGKLLEKGQAEEEEDREEEEIRDGGEGEGGEIRWEP
jgi:hypothetical protein